MFIIFMLNNGGNFTIKRYSFSKKIYKLLRLFGCQQLHNVTFWSRVIFLHLGGFFLQTTLVQGKCVNNEISRFVLLHYVLTTRTPYITSVKHSTCNTNIGNNLLLYGGSYTTQGVYTLVCNTVSVFTKSFKKVTKVLIGDQSLFKPRQSFTDTKQRCFSNNELSMFEVFFLRKNRVFNKGRYSRNRQNYRTGVYICFYLSIASIFGLYYTFYRFSFNLSYLWFLFLFFAGSFIFSKLLKYDLITPTQVKLSVKRFINWVVSIRY